jgi:polyisoprenoid-binding protein YceI
MKILPPAMCIAGTLALSAAASASEWVIDAAHSSAQFRHMMVSTVRGTFDKVDGTVTIDDKDPTKSTVDVKIDANSINTRETKRDAHLKSPDFFDTAKYPDLTFKSTKIERAGKSKFRVTGDLTMHGVTKPVVLQVDGPTPETKNAWGAPVRGLSAKTKIKRKDWGLTWNKALEAGGVAVGDDVEIQIDAELDPKPPVAVTKK